MKLYPGWIITEYGCSTSSCKTKIASAAKTLDACIDACIDVGFDDCKSVQFKPKGSFGLSSAQCTMYDVQLEYMGAHGAAQVLASKGLGAVVASFCEPPAGFTDFPDNERPDFGVVPAHTHITSLMPHDDHDHFVFGYAMSAMHVMMGMLFASMNDE